MLSCNSTRASICGLALSWKYNPQALGASQITSVLANTKVDRIVMNIKRTLGLFLMKV
jgi:hypothetical protein